MNEERLENLLKEQFGARLAPDEKLKARIQREYSERREKSGNALIGLLQAAMTLLTLGIAAAAYVLTAGTVLPFIAGGVITVNLVCIAAVIIQSKNKKKAGRTETDA